MQSVFGIVFKKKSIEKIHSFLKTLTSILNRKNFQTYQNENIGYGFEITPNASFNNELLCHGDLRILLIGDFLNKSQVEEQLSLIERENINEKDIYNHYKDKIKHYLSQIAGVFCLILIDIANRRICIFSDKHGLIPIYYYHKDNIFVFGTSLKCVLSYSDIPRSLNYQVIYELFKLGFIIPPSTLIKDVKMLMPGEILEFSNNVGITKTTKDEPKILRDVDIRVVADEYYRLLENAILTLTKDFNNCALLLSGGIDSAAIAAILAKSSNIKLKCFTIDFNQNNPIEIIGAKKISALFNLDHHVIKDLNDKMIGYFPEVVWFNEAPTFNGVAEYALCKEIKANTELVLTGDGNDLVWSIFNPLPNDFLRQRSLKFSDYYLKMRGQICDNLLDNIVYSPLDKGYIHDKINSQYIDTGNFFSDSSFTDLKLYGDCGVFNFNGKIRIDPNPYLFRFPYLDNKLEAMLKTIPDSFKLEVINQCRLVKL